MFLLCNTHKALIQNNSHLEIKMLEREWFRNMKSEHFQGSIGVAFKYVQVDFDDDEKNITSVLGSTVMTAEICD